MDDIRPALPRKSKRFVIKLVQSLLGHGDIRTTEIYLHVVRNRAGAIVSPIDSIVS